MEGNNQQKMITVNDLTQKLQNLIKENENNRLHSDSNLQAIQDKFDKCAKEKDEAQERLAKDFRFRQVELDETDTKFADVEKQMQIYKNTMDGPNVDTEKFDNEFLATQHEDIQSQKKNYELQVKEFENLKKYYEVLRIKNERQGKTEQLRVTQRRKKTKKLEKLKIYNQTYAQQMKEFGNLKREYEALPGGNEPLQENNDQLQTATQNNSDDAQANELNKLKICNQTFVDIHSQKINYKLKMKEFENLKRDSKASQRKNEQLQEKNELLQAIQRNSDEAQAKELKKLKIDNQTYKYQTLANIKNYELQMKEFENLKTDSKALQRKNEQLQAMQRNSDEARAKKLKKLEIDNQTYKYQALSNIHAQKTNYKLQMKELEKLKIGYQTLAKEYKILEASKSKRSAICVRPNIFCPFD